MALKSQLVIGTEENNQKTFDLVDCRVALGRTYDCVTPTGSTRIETIEVTVYPAMTENFFHKWFTFKNTEEVTLKILTPKHDEEHDSYHRIYLEDAVCYSLVESYERVMDKKEESRRRLLKIGIQAKNARIRKKEIVSRSQVQTQKKAQVFVPKNASKLDAIQARAQQWEGNLSEYEKLKLAENSFEIEDALDMKKENPMSIEAADRQRANPLYKPPGNDGQYASMNDESYSINCATCSTAYILRRRGFDAMAKGNSPGTENEWMSYKDNAFKKWKNVDGTEVEPIDIKEWMEKKGYYKMTPELYKQYFEENTQEEGIYLLSITWIAAVGSAQSGGGHSTIVERWKDDKGELHLSYIEPQVYNAEKGSKRDMKELYGTLTSSPTEGDGIVRVDNKIFDTSHHNNLFL